ncbi:MAG: hypothetical protein GEU80_00470 [Dehalococcoidia bacterium]|nr:hypothetical protein [Dehalococcoidia bacterium]
MAEHTVPRTTVPGERAAAHVDEASAWKRVMEALRARIAVRPTAFDGAVLFVATLAAAVRLRHLMRSEFPLNDGGLFYAMARDVQASRYGLPEFTSYNGGDIPFSYPPFGIYVAALSDHLLPLDLEQVFRLVPLVFSVLTVLAVFLLARSLFGSLVAAVAAGLTFACVPRAFLWLIMGGGVTRAPGLFVALMALYFLDRALQQRSRWMLLWATVCSALTVLSHLETAWFLATSVPVFLLWRGRSRFGVTGVALFGLGTVALTAPWWGLVLIRHGLSPFLAAMESGGTMLSQGSLGAGGLWDYLQNPEMTSEPLFPVFWLLALLGFGVALGRGSLLLPVWWASIVLIGTRAAPTFVIVPMALLVGGAAIEVRWWLAWLGEQLEGQAVLQGVRFSLTTFLVAGVMVLLGSGLVVGPGQGREGDFLQALSVAQVHAIERVERATPESAQILVLPSDDWYVDRPAEWLPALTGRVSLATPQGQEWLPGSFEEHAYAHWLAWGCSGEAPRCLERWAQRFEGFDYVFVPGQCCSELLATLRNDRRYDAVFVEPGGALFARPGLTPGSADEAEVSRESAEFDAVQ